MPDRIKPKIVAYHLRYSILNRTLSCKFEKWCIFSGWVKAKLRRKKSHKRDQPAINLNVLSFLDKKKLSMCTKHCWAHGITGTQTLQMKPKSARQKWN
jgi:hypothetical protein